MDRGGDEPSITELNWQCNDETRICECTGAFWSSDCVALYKANSDCKFVHAFADGAEWCRVPDGGPIFHPDGTKAAPPTDGPPVLNPGDLPDAQDPTRPGNNEPGQDPDGPGDDGEYEEPERPLPADPPPPGLPPSVDPDDVIKPGDLPGAEDPGRTGNGSADSSTGSVPLDPGGLDR
jgi:hypothetical protein